jgi:hypothetical protein
MSTEGSEPGSARITRSQTIRAADDNIRDVFDETDRAELESHNRTRSNSPGPEVSPHSRDSSTSRFTVVDQSNSASGHLLMSDRSRDGDSIDDIDRVGRTNIGWGDGGWNQPNRRGGGGVNVSSDSYLPPSGTGRFVHRKSLVVGRGS